MLKTINTFYLFSGMVLLLLFLTIQTEYYLPILIGNFAILFLYSILLFYYSAIKTVSFFTVQKLLYIIGFYSAIIIALFNALSYYYNQNYLVFSEADASTYEYIADLINNTSFGVQTVFNNWKYDDWGAIFVISTLYKITASNLITNFFYWILGLFTAKYLFLTAKNFMNSKYAFLCALSFCLASFTQWYNSSGLKESVMVFLVIWCYYLYYQFLKKRIGIFYFFIPLIALCFFRPAVAVFIFMAIAVGIFFDKKRKALKGVFLFLFLTAFIGSFTIVRQQQKRYINYENTNALIENKQGSGMIKGSVQFTYAVNFFSSFVGHFPTISPDKKTMLTFFSSGLIYKVFLSFPLILGMFYIVAKKRKTLYPILIFPLLEIFSLIIILEALELRKSLPHYPLLYIIAFWFLYVFSQKKIVVYKKIKHYKKFNQVVLLILLGFIVYWNFR